jgi:alginate biosynthesis protein AlgX
MKFVALALFLLMVNVSAYAQDHIVCDKAKKTGLIEGKSGWIFRTKTDFQSDFAANDDLKKQFLLLNEAFKNKNIELIIALLPTRGILHHQYDISGFDPVEATRSYQNLVTDLEFQGLNVASVEDFASDQGGYYQRDHHWNVNGARMMAQAVAEKVKSLPVYQNLDKKKFQTDQVDDAQHWGSFSTLLKEVCEGSIPHEDAEIYKTYPVEEDLFSAEKTPEIILLGTSNSDQEASKANFEGFLKEYISADVANLSISGGGFDTSILQYLSSVEYVENRSKVIVWEFPVYQSFRNLNFYKQAVPAVHGECGSNAVYNHDVMIKDNKFKLSLDEPVVVDNLYMALNIPEFNKSKMRVVLNYASGKREPFDFKRSKFYEGDGKFFLDLGDDEVLQSVEGLLPAGDYGNGTISLCRYSSS